MSRKVRTQGCGSGRCRSGGGRLGPVRRGGAMFAVVQSLTLLSLAGVIGWRMIANPRPPVLPPLRPEPLTVGPLYDLPLVVTDEQLRLVLHRLRPRLSGKATKVGNLDHALRFWTPAAAFGDPQYVSGQKIRSILTDHRAFAELYGREEKPLLIRQPGGVRVRTQEGNASTSHLDHTLACLAEVGTPLGFSIHTPTQTATYGAMLEQSLRDFSLNQVEYEWSALAYALFLPPARGWTTSEGQRVSFDLLAQRLMRERLPRGVCFGNHRLYTLAVFLRVDDAQHILSPAIRGQVLDHLKRQSAILARNQADEGYWSSDWARAAGQPPVETDATGDLLTDRVLATGHTLEWWAVAPAECLPQRHVIVRAGQWLVKAIGDMTDEEIQDRYTYLSHAGRALALWRGTDRPHTRL